jgi:DNA-binding XRE family transcriptional regulator
MTDRMTGAEIAATRHLIGLTQNEFADELSVSRQAVTDWERGRFAAREGVCADIGELRRRHDREVARLAEGAGGGVIISLPDGPRPRGWYLALGARLVDRVPDAMLDWA